MSRALALVAVLVLAIAVHAQEPTFPSHDVTIDVVVDSSGRASVVEQYQLSRSPDAVRLEMRGDPCAHVGPVVAMLDTETLDLEEAQRGPWTLLGDRGRQRPQSNPSTLQVRYDVELGEADAMLPLVLPSARLERVDGSRGANVRLTVTFADDLVGARVLFPRFDRAKASSAWQAQLLAVPSMLRLRVPQQASAGCAAETSWPSGGLEWRFWLFTGIMVVWVPVYLWVFGRRSRGVA